MFSNLVYILNNYLVSWANLHAPEVSLVRGVIQVPVFGFVLFKNRKQNTEGISFVSINYPQGSTKRWKRRRGFHCLSG